MVNRTLDRLQPTTLDRYAEHLRAASPALVRGTHRISLASTQAPWHDAGISLHAGQHVTWFVCGETVLNDAPTIRIPARFQVWARIEGGNVFRGTRPHHTFVAPAAGRLQLATYFPGEWATPTGTLSVDRAIYAAVNGDINLLVVVWAEGIDATRGLTALGDIDDPAQLVIAELQRLAQLPNVPRGWQYLWFLGPSESYSTEHDHTGIGCDCERDAAILHYDTPLPLTSDTRLQWRWRIDELPSRVAENTLPTHDYLSIAVEFDNGQDLTYFWSAALPPGTVFRCPIPAWAGRETHAVVRSGGADLGRWLAEERNVYADYAAMIGEPPARIVRVWLIAVSLFQQGRGRCRYDGIEVRGSGRLIRAA